MGRQAAGKETEAQPSWETSDARQARQACAVCSDAEAKGSGWGAMRPDLTLCRRLKEAFPAKEEEGKGKANQPRALIRLKANWEAATMDSGSARPRPAISKAVP